jgi:hypothetical protein
MTFQISDDIEKEIRVLVAENGGRKGGLSDFAEVALSVHLRKLTKRQIAGVV